MKTIHLRTYSSSALGRTTLLSAMLFSVILTSISGQIVLSEIIPPNSIELHNQGATPLDVSEYWLCGRPFYDRIGTLNTTCGQTLIPANGTLVVQTDRITLTGTDGETGLYTRPEFTNPEAIIDFVMWGDPSGSTREATAIAKGIWTHNDRAPAFSDTQALLYDGSGNRGSDYFESASTPCVSYPPFVVPTLSFWAVLSLSLLLLVLGTLSLKSLHKSIANNELSP